MSHHAVRPWDESSSDEDDRLRSSASKVMSSAARQAAMRQLQQYQNAWRWSQQAD
jgi:hypothetical protein